MGTEESPTILVIDDEPSLRDMLRFTLTERGYRVVMAATGEEGVEAVRTGAVDLAIIDIKMPGMDGIEILRSIKSYSSEIAAIGITGYPELESTVQAMRLGMFDYLAKPFEIKQLLTAVERALEHQRRTRALLYAEETNRLQAELLLRMSHEFKAAIENMGTQSQTLLRLVNDILELPKRSAGRLAGNRLAWQELMTRLAQLNKPAARARVLVVDDDPGIVELLEYMLTREGYQVESVNNGQAALDYLAKQKPDFMILDLMMPMLNGFEVLDALGKSPELKNLPVVVLTARYLSGQEQQQLRQRAQGIIQKGQSDISEILALLNEHSCSFRPLSAA